MNKTKHLQDHPDERNIYSDTSRQNGKQHEKKRKNSVLRTVLLIVAGVLVLAILGSVAAYTLVLKKIDTVTGLSCSDISDSGLVLTWNKVNHAQGYYIYCCENEGDDYDRLTTIEDADVLRYEVTGLSQATRYSFFMVAYNAFAESVKSENLEHIRTLPAQAVMNDISSSEEGVVHVEWTQNQKADGYIIEYRMSDEAYSDDNSVKIEGPDSTSADIADLEPEKSYTFRLCAYIENGGLLKGAYSDERSVEVYREPPQPITPEVPVMDENIDPSKPMIALTFDDGPYGEASERILDVLEKHGAKATFFMVGSYVESNGANLERKVNLGMELGNHTWNHSHYGDDVTADDIRKCTDTIYDMTGRYPTAFRSPGGMTTDAILSECAYEGMPAYYWSIDTRDWESRDADKVYHEVMDHVSDGDIVLMHEIYDSTADAVERMVPELLSKGYQLVTCHDLIVAKSGEEPTPGVQYYHMR